MSNMPQNRDERFQKEHNSLSKKKVRNVTVDNWVKGDATFTTLTFSPVVANGSSCPTFPAMHH